MFDWRGFVGTSLIHGAAVFGWPVVDLSVTQCMCRSPSTEAISVYDVPTKRRVTLSTHVRASDAAVGPAFSARPACGSPAHRAPILLAAPPVPASLDLRGSIAFCATIAPDGTVAALELLGATGQFRAEVAPVRALMSASRFAPADDGAPAMIELDLTS